MDPMNDGTGWLILALVVLGLLWQKYKTGRWFS